MACRRMINSKITDDDRFLVLQPATQALYMHLVLHADDDGFVSNPLGIVRLSGCSSDCLDELKKSGIIIHFVSGVICITHWGQHNWIRKDRYTPSILQERRYVTVLRDRTYTVPDNCKSYVSHPDSQPGSRCDSQYGIQDGVQGDSQFDSQADAGWYDSLEDKRHTQKNMPVDNFFGENRPNPDPDWL